VNNRSVLADRKIVAHRSPAKCLVIESFSEILPEDVLEKIMEDVEAKKQHKFAMLDQFVKLLEEYSSSQHLHQEIGLYLGVDKFKLGRVYQTLSGQMVRSKSEVIIANILFERKIPFGYEAELLADGEQFSPDFTIEWKGKMYYWEHLGLLEQEQYKSEWGIKKAMYDKHFSGMLITTTESAVLSKTAEILINQHFV
jgi:ATP-dependent DNA helicase RecQ